MTDPKNAGSDREEFCHFCSRNVPESELVVIYTIMNGIEQKEWVCPDCEEEARKSEKPPTRTDGGSDIFDFPNEGKLELAPAFVCVACGYANVRLTTANGKPAAKCTSCGQGYLETDDPFTVESGR